MKSRFSITLIALFCSSFLLMGQEFSVEVSIKKVSLGNSIEVTFNIENLAGEFKPPKFTGFDIVGGPNHTSSFSIINGKMTQSQAYTYRLRPKSEGVLIIEPAFLHMENEVLNTEPIEIEVQSNPNGLSESQISKDRNYTPSERRPIHEAPKNKRPITKLR